MPGTAKALAAIVVSCCVAAAAAGCGSSPAGHGTASPSVPASVRATQSPGDPHAQILAAYTGMWQAFVVSARTSDYQPGPLQPYAEGTALTLLTHALYVNHQQNVVIRGEPVLHPQVTQITPSSSPDSARLTDCANDTHWREYSRSGGPVKGSPAGSHRIYAWLRLFSGTWKVTYVVVEKAGTCT
jgi:hypothetical protein